MFRPDAERSLCRYPLALSEESRFESADTDLHAIDSLMT